MRTTAIKRWKMNPQPNFIHPAMAGRRAAVRYLRGEATTLSEAIREEVVRPVVKAYVVGLVKELRREFDGKALKRKNAARARCGYKRRRR